MNKPSERIVVFVTAAQKRAISATADELGISISELMRRAVIAFSATSDQVKAASIVDRLNAPRQPDALAQVLQKAAKPLRAGRAGALRPVAAGAAGPVGPLAPEGVSGAIPDAHKDDALADSEALAPVRDVDGIPDEVSHAHMAPIPATHTAEPDVSDAAREIAQAVARLSAEAATAAESEALDATATRSRDDEPLQSLSSAPFARSLRSATDSHDGARSDDAAPEGGKFA